MESRAAELIRILGLEPHPEGGLFVRTFRSELVVTPADARGERSALTSIYYLLEQRSFSRWHRVCSDEAWHWYEGAPLELFTVTPTGGEVVVTILGPLSAISAPMHVVSAGHWQAARPLGTYALVGCTVGPGFEYSDFTLLATLPERDRPPLDPGHLLADLL